jgi:hypothetical protein
MNRHQIMMKYREMNKKRCADREICCDCEKPYHKCECKKEKTAVKIAMPFSRTPAGAIFHMPYGAEFGTPPAPRLMSNNLQLMAARGDDIGHARYGLTNLPYAAPPEGARLVPQNEVQGLKVSTKLGEFWATEYLSRPN